MSSNSFIVDCSAVSVQSGRVTRIIENVNKVSSYNYRLYYHSNYTVFVVHTTTDERPNNSTTTRRRSPRVKETGSSFDRPSHTSLHAALIVIKNW